MRASAKTGVLAPRGVRYEWNALGGPLGARAGVGPVGPKKPATNNVRLGRLAPNAARPAWTAEIKAAAAEASTQGFEQRLRELETRLATSQR